VTDRVVVDTPVGPVRGVRDDARHVVRFGGVPYANAARFGLPEPVTWGRRLDATRPGASPPQVADDPELVPGMTPTRQAEACLTVEVCVPFSALEYGLAHPVLVWVPGGGYRTGGAALPTYDGAALAQQGAVVIGVNYRLGALGWLAAEGVPSNLGLRDVAAAVEWVRATVPAFGGDPDRIVAFGESAGAGLLAHLLATPSGAGGLAGAVLASGAPAGTLDAANAEWVGERVLEAADVPDVDGLRGLPVAALLDAQERAVQAASRKVGRMPFHPWIDDGLVCAAPVHAELAPVPLVVGTTAHEMELFRAEVPVLPDDVALAYAGRKAAVLGIADESSVRAGYEACGRDLVEAVADLDLHLPNGLLAVAHARRGNDVWRYRFTWESPAHRACHALDLPFWFGTLDVEGWRDFAGARSRDADALSGRMRDALVTFARHGKPGDGVAGAWRTDALVTLGRAPRVGPDAVSERVGAWLGRSGTGAA
jgi:para-nitrobenzyl esterase